ncbi:MAG: carbon-nitrogen hydrolase family protein [Candidatus Geothermarchaeales archaeon]
MSEVKVAAAQMRFRAEDVGSNLKKVLGIIDEAADHGAKLIATPECALSGYVFVDLEHAYENSISIPSETLNQVCRKAEEREVYVSVGLAERGSYPTIYNSGVLIGSNGAIMGIHRKCFLRSSDKIWFSNGDFGCPVFETGIGNVSMLICADARIPEVARVEALKGADMIIDFACWGSRDQYLYHTPTRAVENMVWIIASDNIGVDLPFKYPGTSFIMSPRGEILAKAGEDEEEIIYADIDPGEARDKRISPRNNIFKDRRVETYGVLKRGVEELPITSILKRPVVPSDMSISATALQVKAISGDVESNVEKILSLTKLSAKHAANLIVLPELSISGYSFSDRREALKAAVEIPGRITDRISQISKDYGCYVVAGAVEKDGDKLYNTAFLAGPEGFMAKYRKTHLWNKEKIWCSPGESEYPVLKTRFGNLGIMIGYDGFFPEVPRILTLKGADIIAWPCNWTRQIYPRYICPERALENRVFVVAASGLGTLNGERLVGQSMIVDPLGRILSVGNDRREDYVSFRAMDLVLSRIKNIDPKTRVCPLNLKMDL